jgi:tetratricopeptide (TPR) repeat protein
MSKLNFSQRWHFLISWNSQMYKIGFVFLVLILCLNIIFSQKHSFKHQKEVFNILEDNPLFVPDGKKIKNFTFGYDNLVTDLVWLKIVQYIGGNACSSNYPLLYNYLENITDLDSKFYMPYFVAQILLPEIDQTEKAVLISQKGLENLPNKWEIPYYLGYIYYYYLEDYEQGSIMYKKASLIPGVLSSANRMAINLQSKANKHLVALQMWMDTYENETNKDVKTLIAKKIIREQNFLELGKAMREYLHLNGESPQNLEVLIETGLIEKIPVDPIAEWQKYEIEENVVVLR